MMVGMVGMVGMGNGIKGSASSPSPPFFWGGKDEGERGMEDGSGVS